MTAPVVVDLFAGCGGLSLGLTWAGFKIGVAVEKSPMAAETYFHNFLRRIEPDSDAYQRHLGLSMQAQSTAGLVVDGVESFLNDTQAIKSWAGRTDLLVGGPPCQGFSNAGRRNPADPRNQMVWEFVRAVAVLRPRAFIMENVEGLGFQFSNHRTPAPLNAIAEALRNLADGYVVQPLLVNARDHGVPQNRPRRFLIGLRRCLGGSVEAIGTESASTNVLSALVDLSDSGYRAQAHELPYQDPNWHYARLMRHNPSRLPPAAAEAPVPESPPNHELRKHGTTVSLRFRLAHYFSSIGTPSDGLFKQGAGDASFADISYPVEWPSGYEIAQSEEELRARINEVQSQKHSQRLLRPFDVSPTVMSLPDDFVHPGAARTLTVREMARLQSFPDLFEFRSRATTGGKRRSSDVPQYTQVGNAVPPLVGLDLGRSLCPVLS